MLAPGARLGPYEVRGLLGRGGMGEVYRALDPRLGREVALKVLPADAAGDPERLRRFDQEARAAGALNHPAVLAVYDVGLQDGCAYVVTELLEGATLRERLSAGRIAPRLAADWAAQLARGLRVAHERGIVHRDLKPENLFVTHDGRAKILDFGLAKLQAAPLANEQTADLAPGTEPGALLGTVGYMAPEQVRGQPADPRADVFAFGAVLYEMLSGRRAFLAGSPVETLHAILADDPAPVDASSDPHVPPLERVARRCLEKEPGLRFQSARDVVFALEALAAGASDATPLEAMAGQPRVRTVAVLPFKDLARDPANATLGLGLADATITELCAIRSLTVRPTAAILGYREGVADPRQAGRDLGVDAVVDASFQRAGARLRVTVQLVSTREDRPLWATRIDVSRDDLFDVQDEVSRRIVEALHVELSAGDAQRLAARALASRPAGDAYELYLQGRAHLASESLADLNAAIECFERARREAPRFALASVGLAEAYAKMAYDYAPEGEWYERARAMCQESLALDPGLPEGRFLCARLAWTAHSGFDHATALPELAAALSARPGLTQARNLLGMLLFHIGLVDEALRHFRRVLEAHPEDAYALRHVASCRFHQGRFAEALELAERSVPASAPWAPNLEAMILIRLGRLQDAAAAVDRMQREFPGYPAAFSLRAVIAAGHGDAPAARRYVDQTVQHRKAFGHYHHAQYDVACAFARLGETSPALEWLREAAGNGYPCQPFFALDPLLDPLREMPEFQKFLADLERDVRGFRDGYERLFGPEDGSATS